MKGSHVSASVMNNKKIGANKMTITVSHDEIKMADNESCDISEESDNRKYNEHQNEAINIKGSELKELVRIKRRKKRAERLQ